MEIYTILFVVSAWAVYATFKWNDWRRIQKDYEKRLSLANKSIDVLREQLKLETHDTDELKEMVATLATHMKMHQKDYQVRVPAFKEDGTDTYHRGGSFVTLEKAIKQGYLPKELKWLMQNCK